MRFVRYFMPVLIMISTAMTARAELIVLAAPPSHSDSYYQEFEEGILAFHVAYAKEIEKHGDQVIVLSNDEFYEAYAAQLGPEKVLKVPMLDIWMRDFTVLNTENPVMFRYSAAGQDGSQGDADAVQEEFAALLEEAGLSVPETDLINDGGNFVDDYAGNVVLSRKFLRDNDLNEEEARQKIIALTQAKNVAFIEADEQGGLEHADGVVSFVDENTLIINAYPEDPDYARQLKADLRAGLPNVKIHEIITPYDGSETYDAKFGSACGLYTNALVTAERIYFPQFGIPEDKIALDQVRAVTTRDVIPIASHQVCHLGGGVRCMSLQLRGEEARKFRSYVQR